MHLDKEMEYNDDYIKALLVEKLAGTISKEDELIADRALVDSPQALAYWNSIRQQFQDSSRASNFLAGLNQDEAWGHVSEQLERVEDQPKTIRRKLTAWHYAISAVAVLAIAFGTIWMLNDPNADELPTQANQVYLKTDDGQTVDLSSDRKFEIKGAELNNKSKELSYAAGTGSAAAWATLVIPPTKDYKVKLDDGTIVWLNAASSLRFPFRFEASKREVYLTGEAYFEVAKNSKVPFVVHTDYAAIHVHGTSFNVSAYKDEIFSASLVEGAVTAVKDDKTIQLKPGEEVFEKAGNLGLRNFDAELLSWRSGTFYFHRKSLADIAQVLVRWYDVKIAWKSPSISSQAFTGEIDKRQSLDVVLSNLQLTSGINSKLENGILTFY